MDDEAKQIIETQIIPKLYSGDLSLFLGSDISAGTLSKNGKGIPSTNELVRRICDSAGFPEEEANLTDLNTAFGVGQEEIPNFEDFLVGNFKVDSVHQWQTNIFKLWWKVIFTTCIDNVASEAVSKNKSTSHAYPDYQIYNYRDSEPVHSLPTSPPLIYLHGNIDRISDGLFLDGVSYGESLVRQSDWMKRSAINVEYGNCLFVGSKFTGTEIETAIRSRLIQPGGYEREPSWIVLKKFTTIEKSHYLKRGVTPVTADASEFFDYIISKIEHITPEKFIKRKAPYLSNTSNQAAGWFSENFEHVSARLVQGLKQRGPLSRFYMGDLPDWFYIAHNVPAILPPQKTVLSEVSNFLNSDQKCKLIAVTGPLGSGKTTACMMAAAELSKHHLNIHAFKGMNGIDIEHLWNTIKDTRGLFCLFIDAAYEHFYAINAIFKRLLDRPVSCRFCVIIEERTRQFERNKHHFFTTLINDITQVKVEKLNIPSATKLYERSLELGIRFEKLRGKTKQQAVREIVDFDRGYKGDLLATLYDLSSGKSYKEKLAEEYQEIENKEAQAVYQTVALVTSVRLILPLNFICESHEISIATLQKIIAEDLNDKIHTYGVSLGISARHHSIAEYHLLHNIPAEQAKQRLISLMQCLSSKFSIEDIKHHPLSYKIYRSTLSFHYLTETLFKGRKNYAHIHDIYSACQTLFAADGVFWLQYGRFLEKDGDIDGAIHCFRKGLGLYDSFQVRHALGQTLLKQYSNSELKDRAIFDEGVKILIQEIDARGHHDVYPYTSLSQCLIKIATQNPGDSEAFSILKSTINRGIKLHKDDVIFVGVLKDYMRLNPEATLN